MTARAAGREVSVTRAAALAFPRAARLDRSRAAQQAHTAIRAGQSRATSARMAGKSQGRVRKNVSQKDRTRATAQPRGRA